MCEVLRVPDDALRHHRHQKQTTPIRDGVRCTGVGDAPQGRQRERDEHDHRRRVSGVMSVSGTRRRAAALAPA